MKSMAKKIALVIMVIFLFEAFAATQAQYIPTMKVYAAQVLTVTGDPVNVRSGAGTSYSKIATVHKGATYTVQGTAKDSSGKTWYKITINGKTGYILGTFCSVKTATTNATLTVKGDYVNVRSGPGSQYGRLTTIKNGSVYTVQDATRDADNKLWYKINIGSNTGWVIETYVTIKGTVIESPGAATTTKATTTTTKAASGTQTVTVTGDVVNVRSGAGTGYSKVTTVKKGAKYTVQGSAKDSSGKVWYKINVNGTTGYIISTYVTVSTAATTTTTKATTTTAAGTGQKLTVTGDVVNVRKGAGTNYSKVTTVKYGQTYAVLGSAKDSSGKVWYKISVNGTTGYICSDYVKLSGTATTTTTTTTKATTTSTTTKATTASTTAGSAQQITVTGDVVNVRKGAGTNYAKVTTVRKGAKFMVQGSAKDSSGKVWYKISVNGTTGYIISTYAKVATITTTAATTTKSTASTTKENPNTRKNGVVKTTSGALNVRSKASTSGKIIGSLKSGTKIVIVETLSGWYKIEYSNGYGYVSSSYVTNVTVVTTTTKTTTTTTTTATSATTATSSTASSETTTTTTTTTTKSTGNTTTAANTKIIKRGVVKTTSGALNVRSKASTSGAVIGSLKSGTKVVIVETLSGWYKIEYSNGYGYVSSKYITSITEETVVVDLKFDKAYYYVNQGSTVNVGIKLNGFTVSYFSANSTNAPVTYEGVVTGKTPGLYTITAKLGDMTATTEVVVLKAKNSDVQPMTISESGASFIAQWEGGGTALNGATVFYPYKDPVGYWTVGYGHAKVTAESKNWSSERAIAEFNKDITALIGEEHIITDAKPYLTLEEAQALLHADLNKGDYVKAVSDWSVRNGVKLTQQEFDALVSFCFNLGPAYWTSDTYYFYLKSAIICMRSGQDADDAQIIEGFCRYIKAGGVNLKGLWYRRRNEAELFLTGDYAIDRDNKFTLPSNIVWA